MKYLKWVALLVCPLLLCSCATITTGTTQKVSIATDPEGVKVTTNSGYKGVTPCVFDLERKRSHMLMFKKKGFEDEQLKLNQTICWSTAGNIIVGGFIGLGVDAMTGAICKLTPEEVYIVMTPIEEI